MEKNPLAYIRVIDKIRLPEEYHRGKKLLEEDKAKIRQLYKQGGYTYRSLAKLYGVSYGTIQITLNEETRLHNLELRRRWAVRHREEIREKAKGTAIDLRHYKKKLIIEGKIKVDKE